jgi:uncharacterized protein (TIGR02996 family)
MTRLPANPARLDTLTHAAFLDDVLAHPEDDTPRLIYADWLEDLGEADRAEFIRSQIERIHLHPGHPRSRWLLQREVALLERGEFAWAGPLLPQLVTHFAYRRGFVESISLSARDFLRRGEELFRLAPLRRIHLTEVLDLQELLADSSQARHFASLLTRVRELDFNRTYLNDVAGQALLGLPELPRPRGLHLANCSLSGAALEVLAASPVLEEVVTLEISASGTSPEGLSALLQSRHLRKLEHLVLRGFRMGDRGIGVLIGSPVLSRVRTLFLGHNGLSDTGVRALLESRALTRLQGLELSFNYLTPAGLAELAGSRGLGQLTDLNLSHNHLGNPGARVLGDTPLLGQLLSIDLSLNHIGDQGGHLLACYPRPARLLALDLIFNDDLGITSRGVLVNRFGAEVCIFERQVRTSRIVAAGL